SRLYQALCLHPDAAWISNWVRLFPGLPQLAFLNRAAPRAPELRRRVWFGGGEHAYVYGERRPLWERLFPMPVEGEPLYARAGVSENVATENGDGTADVGQLRAAFESLRKAGGGTTVVSKR